MTKKDGKINGNRRTRWALATGIIAAIASSACCILPLVLFFLGISGAWVGNLTAMEPYRPYFLTIAIFAILYGYWKVYSKPNAEDCEPGSYCSTPQSDRMNKVMLWIATVIIALVLVYPYVAPAILERF